LEVFVKFGDEIAWHQYHADAASSKVCSKKDGINMTCITRAWLVSVVMAAVVAIPAAAQNSAAQSGGSTTASQTTTTSEPSLGAFARSVKKDKKQEAAKTFDNDNLPREDKLSVVGPSSDSTDSANAASDQQAASTDAASSDKAKRTTPAVTPGESQEQRQQVYDQWKEKIASQQSEIDLLSRELDVQQREYKLRAAEFYGDAGERMRNQAGWDKEDAKYKDDIADKQKALDEARQRLSDMQEDARKAGVPTSQRGEDQQQPQ
jgi:hypothetical protein